MTKDEALKLALEALELHGKQYPHMVKGYCLDAITAIKEALAQPEQEPVAYIRVSKTGHVMACAKTGDFYSLPHKTLLYTTPPQRKPLSDEEIEDVWANCSVDWDDTINVLTLARAIEAAHGIKGKA